jgi:aspartate aminotransferase
MQLTDIATAQLTASHMAETLIGSEIIKLAGEINEKIKQGHKIYNLTIGDFDPQVFPIPVALRDEIIAAYLEGHTNYPVASGMPDLVREVSSFIQRYQGLHYAGNEILISGGARPLIYAIYKTILDPGDKVLFPIPSWNNNHYCHLSGAQAVSVETCADNNFMPTAEELQPFLSEVALVALCSPLNPTGTVFDKQNLTRICEMIVEENKKREGKKPLYLMYDQIYWALTFGDSQHVDPVTLVPEMRPYTIYVDGLSKAFAATGVRVGWSFGPATLIDKMKSILSHVGAWSPKAEQVAAARFLHNEEQVTSYLTHFKKEVEERLHAFYDGFIQMKKDGFAVDVINPQAAIYLTVNFNVLNKITPEEKVLKNSNDITYFLVQHAGVGIVPFSAFGTSGQSTWFRLSVGTAKMDDIAGVFAGLRKAMQLLK